MITHPFSGESGGPCRVAFIGQPCGQLEGDEIHRYPPAADRRFVPQEPLQAGEAMHYWPVGGKTFACDADLGFRSSSLSDVTCAWCRLIVKAEHAEQERQAARGDEPLERPIVVTDFHGCDITARIVGEYGSVPQWLATVKANRAALDGMMQDYSRKLDELQLPRREPGEAMRREAPACICRGGGPVCSSAGATCPRGSALHAASFLPTLDEVRARRGKGGQ